LIFIDTNIAIDLRDAQPEAVAALARQDERPSLSVITRIELESGVFKDPALAISRRETLHNLLARFPVIDLNEDDILAYGQIVSALGFDRRRILDRLIAAQCLTRNAALITRNPRDFREIDGVNLIEW
jgi:tRNA(fMet)-specific endonuclease VapC